MWLILDHRRLYQWFLKKFLQVLCFPDFYVSSLLRFLLCVPFSFFRNMIQLVPVYNSVPCIQQ
ncbi:hypothetical protein LINPERHAP1_LOCUS38940, partial [Linum perenne]